MIGTLACNTEPTRAFYAPVCVIELLMLLHTSTSTYGRLPAPPRNRRGACLIAAGLAW